jgi:MoaD family protein
MIRYCLGGLILARILLRTFSVISDIVRDKTVLVIDDGLRISDFINILLQKIEGLRSLFEEFKPVIMVNGRVVDGNYIIKDGDEIAILPPASGG